MSNISGLNWVTTSVINTLTDYEGGLVREDADGKEVKLRAWQLTSELNDEGQIDVDDKGIAANAQGVCVAHVGNFFADRSPFGGKICRIQKALPVDAKFATQTLNFEDIMEGLTNPFGEDEEKHKVHFFRLFVYVGIEPRAGEPFYYSNSYSLKGLPFSVDFTVKANGDSAEKICERVYKMIKKNKIFVLDKEQVKVKRDGAKLKFTCVDSMQRLRAITIKGFGPWDEYRYPITEFIEKNVTFDQDGTTGELNDEATGFVVDDAQRGLSEFGTYNQLINDLRLPTIENRRWKSPTEIEQPIPGAKYVQYIITMVAPANNGGVQAVGERMISETTHIFWVKEDLMKDFEALFTDLKIKDELGQLSPIKVSFEEDVITGEEIKSGNPGTAYIVK